MTFNSVIGTMRNGRAAYTPAMRGYICRVDETPDPEIVGVSAIAHFVFVENADVDPYDSSQSGEGVTEYAFTRYTYTNGTTAWFAPNINSGESVTTAADRGIRKEFVLDAKLFEALASSEWEIVDTPEAVQRKLDLNSASRW